nr:hypothetical protein [Angustibacter aerolatus]
MLTVTGIVGFVTLLLSGTGWVDALREGVRAVFGQPPMQINPVKGKPARPGDAGDRRPRVRRLGCAVARDPVGRLVAAAAGRPRGLDVRHGRAHDRLVRRGVPRRRPAHGGGAAHHERSAAAPGRRRAGCGGRRDRPRRAEACCPAGCWPRPPTSRCSPGSP